MASFTYRTEGDQNRGRTLPRLAVRLADRKWEKIFGEVLPAAQRHIADELNLPDPATIAISTNTHDFLVRIVSALPMEQPRVVASDGEFHSFRRQSQRWAEAATVSPLLIEAPNSVQRSLCRNRASGVPVRQLNVLPQPRQK